MPAPGFLTGAVVRTQDPRSARLTRREARPSSSSPRGGSEAARGRSPASRPGVAAAAQRRTAAGKEPRVLTSSLWPSARCCRPGSSRRDCPRGRSTRERWPRRWRTRCSPAPRRPRGTRPAAGGSRRASAPARPRHTARPGLSRGTRLGLGAGKKRSEQQGTTLKKTRNAKFFSYSFAVVFFSPFWG